MRTDQPGVTARMFAVLAVLLAGCGDAEVQSTPKCTKEVEVVCTVVDGLRSCRTVTVCR